MTTIAALERFYNKVDKTQTCWNWTAGINYKGYSKFGYNGKTVYGHRFIYEQIIGPIAQGLQIDHLCRNRKCVNPEHLEAVTLAENLRRQHLEPNSNGMKTNCPKGHEYTRTDSRGKRVCQTCKNIWAVSKRLAA